VTARLDARRRPRPCSVAAGLLLACGLSLLPASEAAAPEPVEPSNLLEAFLAGLDTLSAGFEQTLSNELGEELEKSIGTLYVERPGKFHWAYWEPFPQLIISDGRSLWIYDEDLEQVTVKDVTASIDDSPAALLGGDVDVDAHYVVMEAAEAEGVRWLELTPRDIESQYETVRLGFRDGELAGMELFDNLGQKTRIAFQDVRRNPPLETGLFTFAPPAGVDVVDER
jgi:outer membrane lipoprotein carrier protein